MDCGLLDAADLVIWDYGVTAGAVLLTKDEDFALRRALETAGPAVVWLRVGNTRKAELLRWFEPLLPEILLALAHGETLLEIS
jgi:predicted nuclease of predicted toxin-antitoxin system